MKSRTSLPLRLFSIAALIGAALIIDVLRTPLPEPKICTNNDLRNRRKTYQAMSISQLHEVLEELCQMEDYEEASYVRDLIREKEPV
jgi:hypothetical protein